MGLQTDNLAMIALGMLGNVPANPYQAPLINGIHLRWAFRRELGFPWYGFHLFRRPAQPGRPVCLSGVTGGLKKGSLPDTKHQTAIGLITSDTKLLLTDDFALPNQVEFALDGRKYLRFDLPSGEMARRVDLRIGFRPQRCLELSDALLLPQPTPALPPAKPNLPGAAPAVPALRSNPLVLSGVSFQVKGSNGQPAANTQIGTINTPGGPLIGLACGYGVTIQLAAPSNAVELVVTNTIAAGTIDAFNITNTKVATAQVPLNQTQTIKLTGVGIRRIEIQTLRDALYLHRVCSDTFQIVSKAPVTVTAFSGRTPIRSLAVNGQAGPIISVVLEGDSIDAVEIGPGPASLIDLCYILALQDATQGWEKLTKFTYPLGLPVIHAKYPASVSNVPSALADRVHIATPPGWGPPGPPNGLSPSFNELSSQLVELVKDGPAGLAMADRLMSFPLTPPGGPGSNTPDRTKFYALDMVLLGAIHPALAQMIGLYWVDQTAVLNVAYDYLVVADHTGVGQRNADTVLAVIKASGFAQLDGYIVFNKRAAAQPPLPAPGGIKTYDLPGGTFPDALGNLPPPLATNNAGLTWDIPVDSDGILLPERPILNLVWRADQGNAATPVTTAVYNLVSKRPPNIPKPVMVTEARLPKGSAPERCPGWEKAPFHFLDRNIPDGWYSYQVSGIDLFGRHTPNSAPAQIRLLDKIPPPMPPGVEAYALDPADPFLTKDAAYMSWYNAFPNAAKVAMKSVIGLRVRWRWTERQQRQARDTSEFRIYFHPGTELPANKSATPPEDHSVPKTWSERFHVVGINEFFTAVNPTNQAFNGGGGTGSIAVTAASGVKWWATSKDAWITITSGSSGTGNGPVAFSVAPNTGPPRCGTLLIAGNMFLVNQKNSAGVLPPGQPVGSSLDRAYEIFLPRTTPSPVGLAMHPSLAEPVEYAFIGVSASDNKPYTADKRTTGAFGNRPGNEGAVGTPARIYCVRRVAPPPPIALADTESVYASPADYHNRSYYTYRWITPNQADKLRLHLFRAMDDAIFTTDWQFRVTRIALDPGNAQHKAYFPTEWTDVVRRKTAATALNAISTLAHYDTLSSDAKNLLARLPGNDSRGNFDDLKLLDWSIRRPRTNLTPADLSGFANWDAPTKGLVATELNALLLSGTVATTVGSKITLSGTPDLSRVRAYRDSVLLAGDTAPGSHQYRIIEIDPATKTLTLDAVPTLPGALSKWFIPLYQTLSDRAVRALAVLTGNERAFVQITIDPLDSFETDATTALKWRDRRGPDNPDSFPLHPIPNARRAYIDTLDGRSTNRYLYRAAYVDAAHNQGEQLSGVGPVVYLPKVAPPRAPVIAKVLGGDRQITINWASNREANLAEYRVYRAESEENTRDLRLMTLLHTESVVAGDPATRPADVSWTDSTVTGLVTFYYRLVAIDDGGNVSVPSTVAVGRAFDHLSPPPPVWNRLEWVYLDDQETEHPIIDVPPQGAEWKKVVALRWETAERSTTIIRRRQSMQSSWQPASGWIQPSSFDQVTQLWAFAAFDKGADSTTENVYRLQVESAAGNLGDTFDERRLDPV